jgi:hypothetical protein
MSDARSRPRFHPSRGPRGPERQVSHESGSGHPVDPHLCRPGLRHLLALAALLLVTLGLTWLFEPAPLSGPPSGGGTLVALLAPREGGIKAPGMDVAHAALHPGPEATGMGTRSAVSARVAPILLRKELEEGKRTGRLPPPPAVDLDLWLHNSGPRDLVLLLEEGRFLFRIDLVGPGVERVPVPRDGRAPFAPPARVRLPPDATFVLPVVRLSEDIRGKVRYVYWTEPGRYTLAVRLEVHAEGRAVPLTVTTPPVAVRVEAGPGGG